MSEEPFFVLKDVEEKTICVFFVDVYENLLTSKVIGHTNPQSIELNDGFKRLNKFIKKIDTDNEDKKAVNSDFILDKNMLAALYKIMTVLINMLPYLITSIIHHVKIKSSSF